DRTSLGKARSSAGTGRSSTFAAPLLVILPFFVPRHLNRLQLLLVRLLRVSLELVEVGDPAEQIGEANRQRVDLRMRLVERDADVLDVLPDHKNCGLQIADCGLLRVAEVAD